MTDQIEQPRHFSLRQAMGVVTVFAISFGLWGTNSFEAIFATVIAIAGSAIVLIRSQRRRLRLLIRAFSSTVMGLFAAIMYAAKWGDDAKHYQIGTAVAAALVCWGFITAFGGIGRRLGKWSGQLQ